MLQIWIMPERRGIQPSYEQKEFARDEMKGKLRLVAGRDPADNAVKVHQDVRLFATVLEDETVRHELEPGRHAWIQVARGSIQVNGKSLEAGDGVAVSEEKAVELTGSGEALLFDLA